MNLNELPDEELDDLRVDVLIEQERRQARDQIPAQIADLIQCYIDAGGDPADLTYGPAIIE